MNPLCIDNCNQSCKTKETHLFTCAVDDYISIVVKYELTVYYRSNHSPERSLSISPKFCKFECNTTSDWINLTV